MLLFPGLHLYTTVQIAAGLVAKGVLSDEDVVKRSVEMADLILTNYDQREKAYKERERAREKLKEEAANRVATSRKFLTMSKTLAGLEADQSLVGPEETRKFRAERQKYRDEQVKLIFEKLCEKAGIPASEPRW